MRTPQRTPVNKTDRRSVVGGKAAALETARDAGLPVPPFITLASGQASALESDPVARAAVLKAAEQLGGESLAVRSSGIAEDGAASFAGQLDSFVGVSGDDELMDAIRRVAASGGGERVMRYGERVSADIGAVAVIVQRRIRTEWSGVAFCRDPVTFQPEVVVEAVAGSGAPLVGGWATPARTVLDRETVEQIVAPEGDRPHPPGDVVRAAARLALQTEDLFGAPQDVEWGWDGESLWLLQSRPMTALEGLELYSDTFSAEVWPGLIKPLVFDVGDVAVNRAWGRILTAFTGPIEVDWRRMAALAASRTYFNDSLLGDVLSRVGLPENTLETIEQGERPRLRDGSYRRMARSAVRLGAYLIRNARWLGILEREMPSIRQRALDLTQGADEIDAKEAAYPTAIAARGPGRCRVLQRIDDDRDGAAWRPRACVGPDHRGERDRLRAGR